MKETSFFKALPPPSFHLVQHFSMMSLFSTKFSPSMSNGSPSSGSGADSPSSGGPGAFLPSALLLSNGAGGSVVRSHPSSSGGGSIDLLKLLSGGASTSPLCADDESRTLAFQMALKCADLGHLTSSKAVHRK